MEFTIYQAIAFLNKFENADREFKRVNDEKFKLFKGSYGDLMYELDGLVRPLPIFNYLQDKWILVEKENK